MKRFQTTRRVRHSASDMFALVADVERYPEFVPLCQSLKVTNREAIEGGERITATMTVAYKLISETFTSLVTLESEAGTILVEYLDGPFDHLENRWVFKDLGEARCEVAFSLKYTFKSRTLALLMGAMFDRAFAKFADAFEARANTIYGRRRTMVNVD